MKDKLKQLQRDFYHNVLTPGCSVKNYLSHEDFSAEDLLQIYRNQYFLILNESLSKSYCAVKRLVGEDFFNQLVRQYITAYPSKTGNIIDYGEQFPHFIQTNPHCKTLPYLADVAKLENLYERCYFSGVVFFMHSVYPVVKIWQLNENSEELDLASGADYLKIYRKMQEVLVERITQQQYEERR